MSEKVATTEKNAVVYFSSPMHRGLRIFDEEGLVASFSPFGKLGSATLTDPGLIERLERDPGYNNTFYRAGGKMPTFVKSKLTAGAPKNPIAVEGELLREKLEVERRKIAEEAKKEEREALKPLLAKYEEFGELKARVWKKDGSGVRGDATESDVKRFNALKEELGQ